MNVTRTVVFAALLVGAGFLGGRACAPQPGVGDATPSESSAPATDWTCSMHPQVRLPEPGQCPICFMDLIPASSDEAGDELDPRRLRMSESARALAEIETAPVERRSVAHEVHMVGKVALDETRVATITSWVAGRLDRLYVDYTGVNVRADDHLVEIYSPTLYTAQQELLQAIETAKRLEGSSHDLLKSTSDQTVVAAREKLRLYGVDDDQIRAIVERGSPDELVTVRAPIGGVVVHKNALEGMYVEEGSPIYTIADLGKVWVLLDAYESDLAWLRYGQDVEFGIEAYPGEIFHGRVAFIDPLLDDRTRTVKVRLNVDNTDGRLKPDMFVSATAHAVLTEHGKVVDRDLAGKWMCPMHPEIVADAQVDCAECGMDLVPASELGFVTDPSVGESLVLPSTAPLITGRRAVVYVRVPGAEQPTFEGREVVLGPRAGDWYVVREGVAEGELVVVKGNFKIDSELQIRARPSMMSIAGDERATIGIAASPELRAALGAAVDASVKLQEALAGDTDDPHAARAIASALAAVEPEAFEGPARDAWTGAEQGLRDAADELAAAEDLSARRVALARWTARFVHALRIFGYDRAGDDVGLFHCPMALSGEGADWLQVGATTANPYYGASMLRCGSHVETIAPGSD